MRLFRVARPAAGVVEHDGHGVLYLRKRQATDNRPPMSLSNNILAH
jgi:hypothetical protein